MAFITTRFTVSSALATNGTTTFNYPTRQPNTPDVTTQGDFKNAFGHQAFIEGTQTLINNPKDFTLTFGNSSITFTWLGAQTIPAGSAISIDLHTTGQNAQPPYGLVFSGDPNDASSQPYSGTAPTGISNKVQDAGMRWINFGTPLTASATQIVNASTSSQTTSGQVNTLATAVVLDVPRNLVYASSNSLDATQTITARGFDDYGNPMTETSGALTGTTPVVGKKAFKTVVSFQASTTLTGTVSIGTGVKLGSPAFIVNPGVSIVEYLNGASTTLGTWVAGDNSTPTATTGDVRGTWSPNTAPSTNTNTYEAIVAVPDATYLGATQYAG